MNKKTPSQPDKQIKADERNLVAIDDAYKEASFEDRMYLFWNRYGGYVITAVVAGILGVILYFALLFFAERREMAIQEAYVAATTTEEKLAFAREHSGHSLAGTAFLEVADLRYEEEEYEEAAGLYAMAAEGLQGHPLKGRALLGEAIALILADRVEEARERLTHVAGREDLLFGTRLEANYHLATLALDEGDYERVSNLVETIYAQDQMGYWTRRAAELEEEIP